MYGLCMILRMLQCKSIFNLRHISVSSWDRLGSSLLPLSDFKQINKLLFPLKSSGNHMYHLILLIVK